MNKAKETILENIRTDLKDRLIEICEENIKVYKAWQKVLEQLVVLRMPKNDLCDKRERAEMKARMRELQLEK